MNHPACSPQGLERHRQGPGAGVALCVAHLIAGLVAAFVALGVLALTAVAS